MRRNWQTIPLVVVVGALAGAAIAGRPTTPETDVRISPAAVTTPTPTTLAAATTAPATTQEVATTAPAATPSTSPRSTSTTVAARPTSTELAEGAVPESERGAIRAIIANGTNRAGLADKLATRLEAIGYVDVVRTDAGRRYASSVIYAGEGLRAQALRVAADLAIDERFVLALGDVPITDDDAEGHVIVVAGDDQ